MGLSCSKCDAAEASPLPDSGQVDPELYRLMRRSIEDTQHCDSGQYHLLFKQQHKKTPEHNNNDDDNNNKQPEYSPTRLVMRRHVPRHYEEGLSGTHIYAMRLAQPLDENNNAADATTPRNSQEQAPKRQPKVLLTTSPVEPTTLEPAATSTTGQTQMEQLFRQTTMAKTPKQKVLDWVTVSEEHSIYIADVGLTAHECNEIVRLTEQVCKGQYAAYTYAKQTLGCREFPPLANCCQAAVHTITHQIMEFSGNARLQLDDREPHMVKYDVTKKERQKLDMHTDKSEYTFLISLSNGAGMDYSGGGTFFECLDATVHVQRGHALVFPGKLRHCGQRITSGLRFLLVGFLVDKTTTNNNSTKVEVKEDTVTTTTATTS